MGVNVIMGVNVHEIKTPIHPHAGSRTLSFLRGFVKLYQLWIKFV